MAETESQAVGDWRRMLAARPLRNKAARTESRDPRKVVVHVKTMKPWYLVPPLTWVVPVRPERSITLDNLGSQIWHLCDGNRDVEAVTDEFARLHDLTFHEARIGVAGYVKELIRRGVLAIEIPESP